MLHTLFIGLRLAFAATEPAKLELGKIVDLALENAPLISSDSALVGAEKQRVSQATVWQNPSTIVDGGRIANDEGPGAFLEATLYQTFPFPGKLSAKEKVQTAHLKLAENQLADRRTRVQHETVVLAYRLAALSHLVKHIGERKERFALVRQYLNSRPFASPVQGVERDMIEHKLRFLEEHFIQRESDYRATWHQLNRLIQQPQLVNPDVLWWHKPKGISETTILGSAKERNRDLIRYRLNVDRAEAEVVQGRRAVLPDVNLGFGFRREGTRDPTSFYTGYLTVFIPLWDVGQHTISALEQIKESERMRLAYQQRFLEAGIREAAERLEKSRKTLLLFGLERIPSSLKSFDRAESEFKRGRLPISAFLDFESQSHETQDRVYEAQVEYVQSLSNLLLLAGHEMPLQADQND